MRRATERGRAPRVSIGSERLGQASAMPPMPLLRYRFAKTARKLSSAACCFHIGYRPRRRAMTPRFPRSAADDDAGSTAPIEWRAGYEISMQWASISLTCLAIFQMQISDAPFSRLMRLAPASASYINACTIFAMQSELASSYICAT